MCCSSANGPRNQKLILNSCFSTLDRISEKTQIWNEVFSYRRIDYFLRVLVPAARLRVSSDVRPMLPNHCDKLSRANLAVTAKSIGSSNSRLDWLPSDPKTSLSCLTHCVSGAVLDDVLLVVLIYACKKCTIHYSNCTIIMGK
jgi:hypothetical protein